MADTKPALLPRLTPQQRRGQSANPFSGIRSLIEHLVPAPGKGPEEVQDLRWRARSWRLEVQFA